METILSVLQVIIAVIVVFLVLMHSGKDSGLSGAFGVGSGTGPLGGGSMVERNLNRWTIFFAVLFFVNAIVLLKRPWALSLGVGAGAPAPASAGASLAASSRSRIVERLRAQLGVDARVVLSESLPVR